MSSLTRMTWNRRFSKMAKQGRKRKARLARKSTLSYTELFAALGEPKDPPPKKS